MLSADGRVVDPPPPSPHKIQINSTFHYKKLDPLVHCESFDDVIALRSVLRRLLQRLNAAELLRLYIDFDLLEDAAALTLEYIDAVLGKGPEYFGLKVSSSCRMC